MDPTPAPSSPLRIVAMVEAYSVNGVAKPLLEFCREAANSTSPRVEVSLLSYVREQPENAFTRAANAQGVPLDLIRESGRLDLSVIGQLRAAVRARKPGVLWTNNCKSHFLVRASGLHREVPWVAFHHGYTHTDLLTLAYNQLDRWSHRGARRLVTVCGKFASDLIARGVPAERIRVQHTPIRLGAPVAPEEAHALRTALGGDGETQLLLAVGRLSAEKGIADLLQAVTQLKRLPGVPPVRLVLAGDGPERQPLQSLCVSLGIADSVVFAGHQENIRPYYAACDVFVLPSHTEGSPNVLLEAMAARLPVAATPVGGVPEMVTHEESALLTAAGDPAGLAAAIARLVQDTGYRRQLAEAAYQRLPAHSPQQYFQNLTAIFQEAAAPR